MSCGCFSGRGSLPDRLLAGLARAGYRVLDLFEGRPAPKAPEVQQVPVELVLLEEGETMKKHPDPIVQAMISYGRQYLPNNPDCRPDGRELAIAWKNALGCYSAEQCGAAQAFLMAEFGTKRPALISGGK